MGPLCVCCGGVLAEGGDATMGDTSLWAASAKACCQAGLSRSTTPCAACGAGGGPMPSGAGASVVVARSIF
eukprot:4127331-Amphidinium_carterae.1